MADRLLLVRTALCALVLALSAPAGADLAAGVRAFREERYEDALREFGGGPQSAEARFYAGAARYKLGRHEEALEDLEAALEGDPRLQAGVGSLYLALARYALRLYQSSREPFERAERDARGTRLGKLAREHLDAIAKLPRAKEDALRFYLGRGLERAAAGRPRLALAYLVELRRIDASYAQELVALHLAASWNALAHPKDALAALGAVKGPGPDVQRGRALLALGRKDEALSALEGAAKSGEAPWAEAARALIEAAK
jgi:tetratricopeptide (TPR) repeat protein